MGEQDIKCMETIMQFNHNSCKRSWGWQVAPQQDFDLLLTSRKSWDAIKLSCMHASNSAFELVSTLIKLLIKYFTISLIS